MKKRNTKPNSLRYTDYRQFLRDCFIYKKKSSEGYSFRRYAADAGFSSPSLLREIIDGKKNIPEKNMAKFVSPFSLSRRQLAFFKELVLFNQAGDEETKNSHFSQMVRMQNIPDTRTLSARQYLYYSNWFNSAIREMAGLRDFRPDPEWIASSLLPEITPAKARRALELLKEIGLLKEENGKFVQTSKVVRCDPNVSNLSIRNFNREMIERGKEAVSKFDPSEREISALTLGLSEKKYNAVRRKIRDFNNELLRFVSGEDGENDSENELVCQLNIQLFPLMQKTWRCGDNPF